MADLDDLAVITLLGGMAVVAFQLSPGGRQAASDLIGGLDAGKDVAGTIVNSALVLDDPGTVMTMIRNGQLSAVKMRMMSRYFSWAEFFAGISTARAVKYIKADYLRNGISHARAMDKLRSKYGKPIRVASWWRDPETNREAKGANNSQHLYGRAVDISHSSAAEKKRIIDIARTIPEFNGFGYPVKQNIGHVDTRPGGDAFWQY